MGEYAEMIRLAGGNVQGSVTSKTRYLIAGANTGAAKTSKARIIGVCVNGLAVFFTSKGESLNQKAVNLHMLEDVFGWLIVLIGAIVMSFTDFALLDPILSIILAVFILFNAIKNIVKAIEIFLEKTPKEIDVKDVIQHLLEEPEIKDVHHVHIWSLDGISNCATMHIITDGEFSVIKQKARKILKEIGISHLTLELEREDETCIEKECKIELSECCHHHHHHHNHNHHNHNH